jgi:hypothetical protein
MRIMTTTHDVTIYATLKADPPHEAQYVVWVVDNELNEITATGHDTLAQAENLVNAVLTHPELSNRFSIGTWPQDD